MVAAGRVAGQRVHVGGIAEHVPAGEDGSPGVAEARPAARLRVVVVDLEDDDLTLDVLQVGGCRAALLDDDLGLLVADVDPITDERLGLVLELTLVAVQVANRGAGELE